MLESGCRTINVEGEFTEVWEGEPREDEVGRSLEPHGFEPLEVAEGYPLRTRQGYEEFDVGIIAVGLEEDSLEADKERLDARKYTLAAYEPEILEFLEEFAREPREFWPGEGAVAELETSCVLRGSQK